jgi:hypothetical protein
VIIEWLIFMDEDKNAEEMIRRAVEEWGEEQAKVLRTELEMVEGAMCKVENFSIGIENEPSRGLRGDDL